MKTLNTYINEWKLNNHSSSSIDHYFIGEKPDKNGYCLILVFPKQKDEKLMYITISKYTFNNSRVKVDISGFYDYKNRFCIYNDERNAYWVHLLLFKTDAILILKQLLDNPAKKINILNANDIFNDNSLKFDDSYYVCDNSTQETLSRESVQDMIDKINTKL